jgi:hypothetical protein
MQTFTANEAKTRFGEFLDRAQRSPVGVLKHDRLVGGCARRAHAGDPGRVACRQELIGRASARNPCRH